MLADMRMHVGLVASRNDINGKVGMTRRCLPARQSCREVACALGTQSWSRAPASTRSHSSRARDWSQRRTLARLLPRTRQRKQPQP